MSLQDQLSKAKSSLKPSDDTISYIDGALSNTTARLSSSRQWVTAKTGDAINRTIPPDQRKAIAERTQSFVQTNPRLAAFIATNVVLTGIPLLLFLVFSLSVLFFSLTTGLVVGIFSALMFTATAVGVALFVVVPTIFFTTFAAAFLFFWGLVGFTILQYASQARQASQPRLNGTALNGQTRSRITQSAESARVPKSDRDVMRFSEPRQSSVPFDFSTPQTKSTGGYSASTATALPTDNDLTDVVYPDKRQKTGGSVEVPTTTTTGMMAS